MKSVTRKTKRRANGEGSVYQRADGLWAASFTHEGKTFVKTAKLRKDAIDKRKKALELVADGVNPNAGRWQLADWLDYWLTQHMAPRYDVGGTRISGVSVLTYQKYEAAIRLHIKPYIGTSLPLALADMQPEHVERWQRALNNAGQSADTQSNALQRLSQALDLARRRRLVRFNVAGKEQIDRPALPARKHVKPTEEDLANLLRAIKGLPLEALVWIAMGGGMRRGEVAALEWADITFYGDDHAVIRAHKRRNRVGKRVQQDLKLDSGQLIQSGLKNNTSERLIHVGGMLVAVLHQRWDAQVAERLLAGTNWKGLSYDAAQPAGYLFTNSIGMPLEVDKISKFMTGVRRSADLDIKRFHGLRRAFTTLMSKAGVADRVTMEQVGHKHLDMTHYYQDPMESQKRDAAHALDAELRRLAQGDIS